MMSDWLVGSVAISLGILGFCAAATRAEWPLRWSIARALDKVAGRTAMRLGYISGGAAMVAIGLAILRKHLGWW